MAAEMIRVLLPDMPTAKELLPYLNMIDREQWYSNFGALNTTLERQLGRDHMGDAHIVTTGNATLGLELALTALNLPRGSRVLCPSFTFQATASAIVRAGYVPLFADVDPHTWQLTSAIAHEVWNRTTFSAVVPVCAMGAAQDAAAWEEFSRAICPVIVDAAAAFGNAQPGNTLVPYVYSMHATKALGAGEGGFVACHDPRFIECVRRLSNFGLDKPGGVSHRADSTNAKLSEYHAAVALASLARWEGVRLRRQGVFNAYLRAIGGVLTRVLVLQEGRAAVPTTMQVLLPARVGAHSIAAHLKAHGIDTRRWYCPPLHRQPAFEQYDCHGDLPVTETLAQRSIGLPFHSWLTEDDVQHVCSKLAETVK